MAVSCFKLNKGLAPSFNVPRFGKANLPFSRRLYLPLNGEMSLAALEVGDILPKLYEFRKQDMLKENTGCSKISADSGTIGEYCAVKEHQDIIEELHEKLTEDNMWKTIIAFQGYTFHTMSGLPFSYSLKKGRSGEFTKELWIDRRKDSKSLAWSSIRMAFKNAVKCSGVVIERPKALGDIRGVSYIYPLFWYFGIIKVPNKLVKKLNTGINKVINNSD